MSAANVPAFAPGVRFHRKADGRAILLIPEGLVELNETAAAIAELIDGERTAVAIAADVSTRYDVCAEDVQRDINTLVQNLGAHAWLTTHSRDDA